MEPYINAYTRDVNQIENLMKQTTLRELLSYRLFPDTNESTTLLYEEFGRHYRSGVDAMLQSIQSRGCLRPTRRSTRPCSGRRSRAWEPTGAPMEGTDRAVLAAEAPSFNLSKQSSSSAYGDYGGGMGMGGLR